MSSNPPRRPHHKSKLGCSSCKKRRIKCDEGRPSCRNCRRRSIECSFPKLDPTFRFSPPSGGQDNQALTRVHILPQTPPSLTSPLPPPSLLDIFAQNGLLKGSPDILRPRFQQILDHFMKITSATIAPNNSQVIWTNTIPQLAGTHIFVLQGIIAVASLHLSRCVDNKKEQDMFNNIAAGQLSVGLSQFRNAIENPTEQNVESLFAFNTITTSFMLTSAGDNSKTLIRMLQDVNLSEVQRQRVINKLVYTTTGIFRSMRGVMVFLRPFWYYLGEGRFSPLLNREWWPAPVAATPEAIKEDQILCNLDRLWMDPGRKYENYWDYLGAALKHLRETFALISQLTTYAENMGKVFDWSSVFTWPVGSSFEFLNLLEGHKTEAWVIMAHYAILPSRVENVWWLDLGPNIIAAAAFVLGEAKWHLIQWPASVVGVNLDNFRKPLTSPQQAYQALTPKLEPIIVHHEALSGE